MGKTTSAKILAERNGFVFYEGDYYSEDNDYGDMIRMVKYEPSVQRKLAGKTTEERKLAVKEMWEEGELKSLREYHYRALCEDINRERARIGGTWVIYRVKLFGQVDLPGDWIVAEDGLINKHNRDLVR